jgi:hypothetical protein
MGKIVFIGEAAHVTSSVADIIHDQKTLWLLVTKLEDGKNGRTDRPLGIHPEINYSRFPYNSLTRTTDGQRKMRQSSRVLMRTEITVISLIDSLLEKDEELFVWQSVCEGSVSALCLWSYANAQQANRPQPPALVPGPAYLPPGMVSGLLQRPHSAIPIHEGPRRRRHWGAFRGRPSRHTQRD